MENRIFPFSLKPLAAANPVRGVRVDPAPKANNFGRTTKPVDSFEVVPEPSTGLCDRIVLSP